MDESDGYVEVRVWRTGSDLSKAGTVTVRSRKSDPVSAEGIYYTESTALHITCFIRCDLFLNEIVSSRENMLLQPLKCFIRIIVNVNLTGLLFSACK